MIHENWLRTEVLIAQTPGKRDNKVRINLHRGTIFQNKILINYIYFVKENKLFQY